jgi:acyl-CoA thioesterase-1
MKSFLLRRHCIAFGLLVLAQTVSLAQAAPATPGILVLGDSLSAEYGLARGTGWVALLQARLLQEKIPAQVVNASISGETSAGGHNRIDALLDQYHPAIVVVELGANDALRGLPVAMTQEHLSAIASSAKAAGAKVLLIGMQVPPNYGQEYNRQFNAMFASVAKTQKTALVPFFLRGVADAPNAAALFQADRIHPIAQAHPTLLNNVWPVLRKLLPR